MWQNSVKGKAESLRDVCDGLTDEGSFCFLGCWKAKQRWFLPPTAIDPHP